MKTNMAELDINGTIYTPKQDTPTGNRYIVVLDRGWIVVGNVKETDGECRVVNAFNLRKWGKNGFGGVTLKPKGAEVLLDKCADIIYRRDAEIMRVPISEDWNA